MDKDRVKTGIDGFDELLHGGFIRNRVILLQGDAGTGKSTFGLQFLIHGARAENEPGLLLSFEYEPHDIIADIEEFNWDVSDLLDQNLLKIASPPGGFENPQKISMDELIDYIFEMVNSIDAKRLVIDSLNSLEVILTNEFDRHDLLRFITMIRDLDCTTILVSERYETSRSHMYSYLAHGVIELYNIKRGANRLRAIEILKMRGTSHSSLTHAMSIDSDQGIIVFPHEADLG